MLPAVEEEFSTDSEDDEVLEIVRNSVSKIRSGDVVAFSLSDTNENYTGTIESINQTSLDICHLDQKFNGQIFEYSLDHFLWINLQHNVMPDTPITDFSKLYPKMLFSCVALCGSEISGRIKRLSYPYIFFNASLPYTDKRVPEAEDDFDEDEMKDKPETGPNEFFVRWLSIGRKYETILPYPIDLEKKRVWKAKHKSPMETVTFTGHGTGFKPGMNLGEYDTKQLHGNSEGKDKLTEYDMLQVKQLLTDRDIQFLFYDATTEKRLSRELGTEKKRKKNIDGSYSDVDGQWDKYKRYAGILELTPELFWVFQAAKLGTLMYTEVSSIKDIFRDDMFGEAKPGRFLHGQTRELFEIMDETLRMHTVEKKNTEFGKNVRDQDPDFGVTPLSNVLLRTSNAVRYISEFLSFDEEIVAQLGKLTGMSYCPDKKNKRGRKVFSLNGCNHSNMEQSAPKGYYFYWCFYRGKARHQTTPFSAYGLGFEVLMMGITALIELGNNIRWGGYMLGMDSFYTSIPVILQLAYWHIKAIGTVNATRKGLGKKFVDMKKELKKDYNGKGRKNTKTGGYEKGFYKSRGVDGEPLVAIAQKDSKVMIYLTNFVSTTSKAIVNRYDKESKKSVPVEFQSGHKTFNFLYGMVDQATSWRSKVGGHKTKASKWWKTFMHYLLFGVLLVNSFMNMKLANKNDSRTFGDFKKSLIRYSSLHVREVFLRQRKRRRVQVQEMKVDSPRNTTRKWRATLNPYATEVGNRQNPEKSLQAAAVCSKYSIRRMIRIDQHPKYRNKKRCRLLCQLCLRNGHKKETRWCCQPCGGAYCIEPPTWGQGRYPNKLSCMDAAHQPEKVDLRTLKVKR